MKILMRILITCAKANLPLRGHNESEESLNKGVFLELVDLVENESQTFQHLRSKVPENAKYTSGMSQNAMLSAISDCALDVIGDELRSAPFYAVIADETRDIGITEQMSICVRYVYDQMVKERFLGFIALKKLDAGSLADALLGALDKLGLDRNKLVGQCYDTASVMSGQVSGVQKRVRDYTGNPCMWHAQHISYSS